MPSLSGSMSPKSFLPIVTCLVCLVTSGCGPAGAATQNPSDGGGGTGGQRATGTGASPGTGGGTGTGGAMGTGGATGTGGTGGTSAPGRPGVVAVVDAVGTKQCVPLCVVVTVSTQVPPDDWSYENNASCVLPNTVTGKNQTCTTGQQVPPPESRTGVVVVVDASGTRQCLALCVAVTTSNTVPPNDWSYENNANCILPNTVTGKNQPCMTGQSAPAPAGRAGILVGGTDGGSTCVALCATVTVSNNTPPDDYSYENNASCVLQRSLTTVGKRPCTTSATAPMFAPPALTGTKVHNGFYIANGRLTDATGHEFVIRGVNNAHIFYDTNAQYYAYNALDNIAAYGTNAIRVVWDTTTMVGTPPVAVPAPASLLAEILFHIVELKMVPIVVIQGTTNSSDPATLTAAAAYYVRSEVKKVLLDFQDYLLINIANEWSGTTTYVSAYTNVIGMLRGAGINHTLVIDANGSGQIAQSAATRVADINAWLTSAANLLTTADPVQHNLLFSVHMYEQYPPTLANVATVIEDARVGTTLPLVVGEFGNIHNGVAVDAAGIMAQCLQKNIGYIGWSWFGNTGAALPLNMAQAWEGPISTWGAQVLTGANGVMLTSRRASIFP